MRQEEKLEDVFVLRFAATADRDAGTYRFPADLADTLAADGTLAQFPSFVQLTTCNRSEIYGTGDPQVLEDLLLKAQLITVDQRPLLIVLQEQEAIEHIMRVPTGLDSKLIGDLEVLGQFKNAFRQAKERNSLLGAFERLANSAIAAAKEIRMGTDLNSGISSISYSAVHLLKQKRIDPKASILLVGAGSFAKSIAKNIHQYFPCHPFAITNRTREKAETLAGITNAQVLDFESLAEHIQQYDVIITAVGTDDRDPFQFHSKGKQPVIVDLCTPAFFAPTNPIEVSYFSLDDATKAVDQSLNKRQQSVDSARAILSTHIKDFVEWNAFRAYNVHIRDWKETIEKVAHSCPYADKAELATPVAKNKSVREFVKFLKSNPDLDPQESPKPHYFEQAVHDPFTRCCKKPAISKFQCQECPAQFG